MILPVSLEIDGTVLLMVGGGKAASQKLGIVRRLIADQAPPSVPLQIHLVAPQLGVAMARMVKELQDGAQLNPAIVLQHSPRGWIPGDLETSPWQQAPLLVWAFTDQESLNQTITAAARQCGILTNAPHAASISSPAARLYYDQANDADFLVSVASLAGPARTRGKNPKAAKDFLNRLLGPEHPPVQQAQAKQLPAKQGTALSANEHAAQNEPKSPYMPLMIGLYNVLVFGGERGEGLQKSEKLALYAQTLRIVPESTTTASQMVFGPGPLRHGKEALNFDRQRTVPVLDHPAQWYLARPWRLATLLRGVDFVCSDLADQKANATLHHACQRKGIRHTVVDTKNLSDTWFMSLIDTGPLVAGLSSRGNCAFYAARLRQELQGEFASRSLLASLLAEIRTQLPRHLRLPVLECLYNDAQFRESCAQGNEAAARAQATIILKEEHHGESC